MRWGTALHDRWLLPHFVAADMRDVVADLASFGYPLAASWFDPFVEFRFPRFGTITCDGVTIEVRQAIEPWHVLGEEVSGTGTARYVDSSVERLQVKVSGMIGGRHWVACNGRKLPLASTGIPGEYVAGVRFRAWSPPSALHPTIGVQAPLVFDLVDTWAERALGGCTYHVAHPGGRNYDTFPVNANEAEARRVARFWAHGHTPGAMPLAGRTAQSRDADDARPAVGSEERGGTQVNVRTRFAPSPTGFLHLGGARTALFAWAYARRYAGTFILRIEDTDVARSTPEAVQAILDAMAWLGLTYDEGPFYQMQRMDRYRAVLREMLERGPRLSVLHAARRARRACARRRWPAAKSRATTGGGAPRMPAG